tara:strand:- start:42 stop:560 length:519 start_codon:yes stop_codon:yes gene_type:complete
MTSNELRDLVKSHFSLVEAEVATPDVIEETFSTEEVVKEEATKVEMSAKSTEEIIAEEFDARTDAEEEGYLDGIKDEKADIAEEEKEKMMDVESIVEAIVAEVKDEMGKMKTKMAELEEKIVSVVDAPAAEATKMSSKPAPKAKFSTFNVESAKNADRIKAMTAQLKNNKNK